MGVLQRFERRLGGFVEGAFAKVFKGEVHPSEIAARLQREADDRKVILDGGRTMVPNRFTVALSPRDNERLAPYAEPLGRELSLMVREYAQEVGYVFVGPVAVALRLDDALETGIFRVASQAVAGPLDPPLVIEPEPVPVPARRPVPAPPVGTRRPAVRHVVFLGVMEVTIDQPVTVIGRAPESGLRLDDPGVSRQHAQLVLTGTGLAVRDLGSTNGTYVNNVRVGEQLLRDGDRIRIGSTDLLYRTGDR